MKASRGRRPNTCVIGTWKLEILEESKFKTPRNFLVRLSPSLDPSFVGPVRHIRQQLKSGSIIGPRNPLCHRSSPPVLNLSDLKIVLGLPASNAVPPSRGRSRLGLPDQRRGKGVLGVRKARFGETIAARSKFCVVDRRGGLVIADWRLHVCPRSWIRRGKL
ncbi:hypothetical protein Rs2_46033 [Raphanus sativus]|nr:hypothetical protein Rs2_46033 [Raphanus sativus]